ncbi:MAG: hypothetical protein M3Z66_13885 [Chloroflexota bacterium]|nr:hypothetical protein [Chloroflexota bacterium]
MRAVPLARLAGTHAVLGTSPTLWSGYVLVTLLCLYTEYTTIFVLLPQVLLLVHARRHGIGGALIRAWLAIAVLFSPWVGTLALDTANIAGRYWIPAPNWSSVVNTSLLFLGMRTPCPSPPCSGSQIGLPFLAGHEGAMTILAMVAVAGVLAIAVWRHDLSTAVVVLWLVAPFAVILLLALRRPLYLDRIFLDATFPLYLLLGAGATGALQHPRRAVMGMLPIAIVLGSSLAGLQMGSSTSTNPDWRPLTRDLAAAYRPGQAVLFVPAVVRSIVRPYLPPGWHATREELMWYDAYLDVPGWTRRYGRWSDNRLRDFQMRAVTGAGKPVWLVTMDYTGTTDTRAWFAAHGYHLLLSEIYAGDTRLELWDRGLPSDLGPPVLPDRSFSFGWVKAGKVAVAGRVARESGRASLTRNFSVRAGTAYAVNVEWRSFPPAYPQIQISTFDRFGKLVGSVRDRYGYLETSFPRTEWYSLPATGVWLSQPFGFVAPPGAVRARISISNLWGETDWRRIAVYGER